MNEPLDISRLATAQLVPCTPFSKDGKRVVPEVLGRFIKDMKHAGMRVFLPAAGTGEFHSLSVEEIALCVATTRQSAGADAVVIGPVGMSVDHAIRAGLGAADAGADALLLMPPIHPYLSDAGFAEYFNAIADAVPLKLLAYKKGPVPSDAVLRTLGQQGKLIGVKYAVNEMNSYRLFYQSCRGELPSYCGTAERYAPFFMMAGAQGFTTGAGNLCPRLSLAFYRALAAGDFAKGWKLLDQIRPIEDFRAHDGDSFNISLLKFGLKLCGYDFGPPRPPQRHLTKEDEASIRKALESVLTAEAALARSAG